MNKEIEITMLEKINSLNAEAEQIKEETRNRRSATHRSLAALNELLNETEDFSEEEEEQAAAAK